MKRFLTAISAMLIAAVCISAQAQEPTSGIISSEKWGSIWECTPNVKIMRDTKLPANKIKSVSIYAAKNEYEPFQLVITPNKALKNVKVAARTLVGPNGAKIEAWNVDVRNVEYLDVKEPTLPELSAGMYPDPLPPFTPFAAQKDINNPVWITVYVAPKTKAGDYKGVVEVSADGIKKISVPVKLHVWNFELPSVSKLRTSYGCDYDGPIRFQGAKTTAEKRKLVDLYNLDFWRHRVAPIRPYEFYDVKTSLQNGDIKLDFSDFDIAVKKYFSLFNSFSFPYQNQNVKGVSDEDSQRLNVEYLRGVAEHLVDKGQIEKSYLYVYDEPSVSQYNEIKNFAETVGMADARIKFLLTEKIVPDLIGSVNIWAPILNNYDQKDAFARQKAGDEVWWYVCCNPHQPYPNNFIEYPSISPRILHWITWNNKVDGILYYQATWWRGVNPYEDTMSYSEDHQSKWGNGDGRLVYPPVRKPSDKFVAKGPVPSIRWEMIREGMEDYDYFYILQSKLNKYKAAGKSGAALDKAEAALDAVKECAQSPTDYTLDPAKLQAARLKVAEAIVSLK